MMNLIPPHVEGRSLPRAPSIAFAVLEEDHAFLMSPARGDGQQRGEMHFAVIVRAFEAQFEAKWSHATPILTQASNASRGAGRAAHRR